MGQEMKETPEEKRQRLLEEKALLVKGLAQPGMQMILLKLRDSAKVSVQDYDLCDFGTAKGREMAQRIQARRYVILTEIPRMIDEIVNVDLQPINGRKAWSFRKWVEQIRKEIPRFFRG